VECRRRVGDTKGATYGIPRGRTTTGRQSDLYKIFVYFEAFVHEQISPFVSLPICIAHTIAIRLHGYCACTIPPQPPFCMPYTIQNRYWEYPVKSNRQSVVDVFFLHAGRPPGRGRWPAPSSRHLRALLSVCGRCSFGVWGVVLVVCVCVGVGCVVFCRCVCVCVTC